MWRTRAGSWRGWRRSAGWPGWSAGDVTAAVLREAESGVSVSAAQNFVSGLRAFLRFCFVEGLVGSDLSQAALLVEGPFELAAAAGDQQGGRSRAAGLL